MIWIFNMNAPTVKQQECPISTLVTTAKLVMLAEPFEGAVANFYTADLDEHAKITAGYIQNTSLALVHICVVDIDFHPEFIFEVQMLNVEAKLIITSLREFIRFFREKYAMKEKHEYTSTGCKLQ